MLSGMTIAARHHIRTMFVVFDDCWNDDPKPGNSGMGDKSLPLVVGEAGLFRRLTGRGIDRPGESR
jgi:hypothetical protein